MTYPSLENCRLSIMLTHHATTFSGKIPFCENWIVEFFDNFDRGLKWVTSCRMIWIFKQDKFFSPTLKKNESLSVCHSFHEWRSLKTIVRKKSIVKYLRKHTQNVPFSLPHFIFVEGTWKRNFKLWNLILWKILHFELVVKWSANAHKSYSSPHAVAFRKE